MTVRAALLTPVSVTVTVTLSVPTAVGVTVKVLPVPIVGVRVVLPIVAEMVTPVPSVMAVPFLSLAV